ncbi:Solute carrier family 23 member 1 [Triplophysa tibetana]|uniref:Solute carrier family 23 member 1 n=1 Tax=Triplophysa tibetana TaxID=1572043 RepID=A0A5A9NZA6_9TELE|nr:Solute carrier family 23 member 1 [Triplophysa tibetana]
MAPEKDSNGLDNFPFTVDGVDRVGKLPEKDKDTFSEDGERNKLAYCVTDIPPWYLCIILGIQHCLTAFGGIIAIPLILSQGLCLQHDGLTQSHLISTIFFVSGLCTLLQGGTFTLLSPCMALLSMPEWSCPAWTQNSSLVNVSSPEFIQVWQSRMQVLQGSIMVGSLFQVLVGFTGLIGLFMRFIGPLTIAPTISLIGLSLFDSAGMNAGHHWGISAMCVVDSMFNCDLLSVPAPYSHALPDIQQSQEVSHHQDVHISDSTCQWGVPTVSLAGVFGILAGVISSMIESVGDYHACARLSGAPPPPRHAINRGIGIEGIGCLLAGAWGTGNGTTSYSENVGALGITKVGSRMVIVASGFLMIVMGMFGKIAAIFTTIPTPVIGGMFLVMFGVITAAGCSNLQYTDMNSSRNIFIFGFSMFTGLVIPNWILKNPTAIATGVVELDQVLQVLLTTSMFVGGFFGFFLDNTIPGTKRERGITAWNTVHHKASDNTVESDDVYGLPFGISAGLSFVPWTKYVPFCPSHKPVVEDDTPSSVDSLDNKTEPNKDDSHIIVGVAL